MPKTKIICTIGPASWEPSVLEELINAGMNIARLNMSHGVHEKLELTIKQIRDISTRRGLKVAILGDLQGPKIRLGEFDTEPVELKPGAEFILSTQPLKGTIDKASVNYPGLPQDVKPGGKVFLNDGQVQLEVLETSEEEVRTKVLVGGEISSHKGVNLPGTEVSLPPLTEKDHTDLKFLVKQNVDYIACSFVRTKENIMEINNAIASLGAEIPLIAKLETVQGVSNFKSIMEACYGIMLARGDMAVEMPYENIPIVQKVVINTATELQKPVIVATQMLESMTHGSIPTRAEMTDVSNAVIDGAWGVMLSGETASGEHPIEVVKAMVKLVKRAEQAIADGKLDRSDLQL
jgi:pyruvate kinase